MPVEVGTFTTEVTALDGEMPLSPGQLEQLIQLIARRLEEQQRAKAESREATSIRTRAGRRSTRG